jgi:hypothetical protein
VARAQNGCRCKDLYRALFDHSTEFRFSHKNGSARVLQIQGANFLDHPVIRGLMFAASDVTSRKHVDPDLNNVLMGIQPAADILRRRVADPQVTRFVDTILASAVRGKDSTSGLMRFARALVELARNGRDALAESGGTLTLTLHRARDAPVSTHSSPRSRSSMATRATSWAL